MAASRLLRLLMLPRDRDIERSQHPFPEGCGLSVPAWHHFLRTLQACGQATEAAPRKGFCSSRSLARRLPLVSSWQLWFVSSLPE